MNGHWKAYDFFEILHTCTFRKYNCFLHHQSNFWVWIVFVTISRTITIRRFMLHRMLLYRWSDSSGIWPCDIPLSTRFRSQHKFWRSKIDNQFQNSSKIIKIGQKIGLYGTQYFKTKSWISLKNHKSKNGSPEPIFGRSESNEDSILDTDTFRT